MRSDVLVIWTVYKHPSDYPSKYVARRCTATNPPHFDPDPLLADDLESIRALLPPGLHHMPPHPSDDPVIAEIWM